MIINLLQSAFSPKSVIPAFAGKTAIIKMFKRGWVILPLILLTACADLVANADSIAQPSGLHRTQVKTNPFILTAYTKITDKTQPVNVYIEGDGLAWVSVSQPSVDPTPRKALALSMAASDKSSNVIYIARPCQFTSMELDHRCNVDYWTDKRFSEEVISSVNQALNKLLDNNQNAKINLIGYSGGGGVAVLVAARRSDVVSIRTVAGNLDHVELHRINKVSQLSGSLNAIDEAKKVATIPQLHFIGTEDEIVTPAIAQKFQKASGDTKCIHLKMIENATHETGWTEIWPSLLNQLPKCDG